MRNDVREAAPEVRAVERRVDAAAWGLFFVWIGVALLAGVGWGPGLLGVAVITLGAQAWRRRLGLRPDGFSLVVGTLFAIGGIWSLLDVRVEIAPVLCIVAGVWILASAFAGRTRAHPPASRRSGPEAPAHPRA